MTISPRVQEDYVQVLTPHKDAETATLVKIAGDDTPSKPPSDPSQQDDEQPQTTARSFWELYRYATFVDKFCLAGGILSATASGVLFPCTALVFGKAISAFQRADGGVNTDAVNRAALEYFGIAVFLFVTDYLTCVLFTYTAERQMKELRQRALTHMLHMDVGWYDSHEALQLSSRLTGDTVRIKEGMGVKLGLVVKQTCQFFAGVMIGFIKGWDMALVMCCVMPVTVLTLRFLITTMQTQQEFSQNMYAKAGAVAEEALGSIRTVASLTSERRVIAKFNVQGAFAEAENMRLVRHSSFVYGIYMAGLWSMYAVGLWYGGSRVVHGHHTVADMFQAFFAMNLGSSALSSISPGISAIARASGAASAIYKILDTPSAIDVSKDDGFIPESCTGHIQAVDIHFTYPTRPDVKVLNGYNINIESGQTVAFVGASGGGKSTLIALLERFYNPQRGQILLDGRDISTLNLRWLRSQIGMVSQEPVLFARTIYENIAAGGTDVTREQVIEAAKMANAHNFIMTLPQQYDTLVGEKGISLSGGQKQRVAIARAVVRNPKILVLDEATSALDAESERVVQEALNDLMDKTKMTTLVIAHRLSTIRRADKIVVLSGGCVVEEGKHDELLAIENGVYNNLYTIQEETAKQEAKRAVEELELANAVNFDVDISLDKKRSLSVRTVDTIKESDTDSSEHVVQTKFSIRDAMRLSLPERRNFFFGMIGAAMMGFSLPGSSLLMSSMVNSMTQKYAKYEATKDHSYLTSLSHDVTLYGVGYIILGVVLFMAAIVQTYNFGYMAEKLITRLRDIHFTALCRQNIAFFDEKKHATGALAADLSTEAMKVSQVSGEVLGNMVTSIFTIASVLLISLGTGSWILTLVMLGIFPLLVLGNYFQRKQLQGQGGLADELTEIGAHASEALTNMRTVVALGLETQLTTKFEQLLQKPLQQGQKEGHIRGLTNGYGWFVIYTTYALMYWLGGILVDHHKITFLQMMRTLMAMMMAAQIVDSSATFLADAERAKKAGEAIMAIRDRPLPIDSFDEGGLRPETVEGKIEFKDITFRYPTRPGVTVLRHYNLTIEAGQTVAFCGPSGGGKSTCIAMIERFYDPVEGSVSLDGNNLKDLNIHWLRSQIGLVGQEPTLFIGTIAENIAYGLESKPSQEEIEVAAKMANAHDFITQFPDGYETQVGMKGEQLSGGQKQRIAIARAILKNPNILLLDEATSALDSESEKIVQEALDKVVALKKRTTIIIAHRLSTIRKADKICVVSGGKIAEQGTHSELLAMGGIYKKLVESTSA